MIPITRKELYLNKIVGNDDYSVPEKPISEEEFFFAEILGEAVQVPEPLPRYQMYLAKIAGKDVEIPYPETRLEYFLARAAGMDVETPVPITREEIYWSNYTAIVEFELEGVPPLTYKAIEGKLKNYRIYGNTVNGENVGDLITEGEHAGEYCVPITIEGKNIYNPLTEWYLNNDEKASVKVDALTTRIKSDIIKINNKKEKIVVSGLPRELTILAFRFYDINKDSISGNSNGSIPKLAEYVSILCGGTELSINTKSLIYNSLVQLEYGNQSTVYEPYKEPIITNLYLTKQIKMAGDEAEYIDYAEQKQHFADGTSTDVLLPALPTISGTNTLSVGTEVQPSKVYIKGEKEREYT